MKVNIEIDCSPAEARTFFGLPDIAPLQEEMVRQMREKMAAGLAGMDMETLIKTWMPVGLQGMEQMQRMFRDFAAGKVKTGGEL